MELFLYYVLPNIVLFGLLYVVAKLVESATWYVIENNDNLTSLLEKRLLDSDRN